MRKLTENSQGLDLRLEIQDRNSYKGQQELLKFETQVAHLMLSKKGYCSI